MFTKTRAIIPLNNRIEVLSKNDLNKDIQRLFNPFNAVMTLLFSSKYSISNNKITPRGRKYNIVRLLGIFCAMMVTSFRMYKTYMSRNVAAKSIKDPMLLFVYFCMPFLNFATFFSCCINDIVNTQDNVVIIKMIQNLNTDVAFSQIRNFILWNWMSLVMVIGVDAFVYLSTIIYIGNLSVINTVSEIFFSVNDIDFVYTIRLQLLLTKFMEEWIAKVRSINGVVDEDSHYTKMLETYKNILKAYNVFKKLSERLITFRVTSAFYRNLCIFQFILCLLRKWGPLFRNSFEIPQSELIIIIKSVSTMVKMILIIVIHCQYSEKFNMTVEEAKVACILQMKNTNCPKAEKQSCKNVLRENVTFSKMTACGLFYIDGRLPLCLLGLLTQYFVVLLQFAL
ncbi:hypothetical protein SFRURICE_017001 [Spodoptera frugiperda]|nr:hypothetical protein SFRURICE_017001 [Spodoptera frugiperda]